MHSARAADQLLTIAPSFDQVVADHLPMISRIAAAHESNASAQRGLGTRHPVRSLARTAELQGEGGLRSFIARIAANRVVSHVQQAVKLPDSAELTSDLAASELGPESHAIASDESARLVRALCTLPIGLREPALLALEGLTQQEIASVLGITPNAVAIRMTRARSELRKLLGG